VSVDLTGTKRKTKTVDLTSGDLTATVSYSKPKVGHISTGINNARQTAINTFVDDLLKADHLKQMRGEVIVKVTNEMGNTRRTTRRTNVVNAIKTRFNDNKVSTSLHALIADDGEIGDWDVEAYLDKLIKAMWDNFEVDLAFGSAPRDILLDNTKDFVPMGWFPLWLRDVLYSKVFPNCGFNVGGPKLSTIDDHYKRVMGSSPRPAHYMDWRAHKDIWLYDCFNIPPKERPVFCSLSVQPIVPLPNSNYGLFAFLFKRSEIKNRCVHTLGDKQQPRRSMLLLLDDIFYEHTKKDGDSGQSHTHRGKVADDILARMELVEVSGDLTLEQQWELVTQRDRVAYSGADLLIECQIFGNTKLSDIGKSVILYKELIDDDDLNAAKTHLKDKYNLGVLLFTHAMSTSAEYKHPSPDGREDLLDEKAEDHTSLT